MTAAPSNHVLASFHFSIWLKVEEVKQVSNTGQKVVEMKIHIGVYTEPLSPIYL